MIDNVDFFAQRKTDPWKRQFQPTWIYVYM